MAGAKPCLEKNRSSPSRSYSFIARNTSARVTRSQAIILVLLLLWLLARVVLRIDVGEHPRPDIVELNHRLLVHGHEVRGAGRKRDEASRRHGSRLGRIDLLTHPVTERPGHHGEVPAFESVCGGMW